MPHIMLAVTWTTPFITAAVLTISCDARLVQVGAGDMDITCNVFVMKNERSESSAAIMP